MCSQYEIAYFKKTNISMNTITVQPTNIILDTISTVKGGDDEEVAFLKDRSVFKEYKDDTKVHLRKCFE